MSHNMQVEPMWPHCRAKELRNDQFDFPRRGMIHSTNMEPRTLVRLTMHGCAFQSHKELCVRVHVSLFVVAIMGDVCVCGECLSRMVGAGQRGETMFPSGGDENNTRTNSKTTTERKAKKTYGIIGKRTISRPS